MSKSAEAHRQKMQSVGESLDEMFNGSQRGRPGRRYGFALMVFEFGHPARLNWLSNAQRGDLIPALEEILRQWRGESSEPPVVAMEVDPNEADPLVVVCPVCCAEVAEPCREVVGQEVPGVHVARVERARRDK